MYIYIYSHTHIYIHIHIYSCYSLFFYSIQSILVHHYRFTTCTLCIKLTKCHKLLGLKYSIQ